MRTSLLLVAFSSALGAQGQLLTQAALDSTRTYRSLERALTEPER